MSSKTLASEPRPDRPTEILPAKRRQSVAERAASLSPESPPLRVHIFLPADDAKGLAAAAEPTGLSPNAWIAALIRRYLRNKPTPFAQDATALPDVLVALRHIATQLRELQRTTEREGAVQLAEVERLRQEVRQHMVRLRDALSGNLAYWRIEP